MVATLVAATTASGCDDGAGLDTVSTEEGAQALVAENGLAWNGLAWNGLAWNGLAYNGLAWNGLAWNGLAYNGLAYNGLAWNGLAYNGLDPNAVKSFVGYLASCALPANDSVTYTFDGKAYRFDGDLGLAPEWKKGSCGPSCQRWISACMLARLNKLGQHVEISMRGEHKALKTVRAERANFTDREATYYGNLFEGTGKIYTCHSPDKTSIPRVCGDTLGECPMNVVGPCNQVCKPGADGSFRDCAAESRVVYEEAITVFLAPKK